MEQKQGNEYVSDDALRLIQGKLVSLSVGALREATDLLQVRPKVL